MSVASSGTVTDVGGRVISGDLAKWFEEERGIDPVVPKKYGVFGTTSDIQFPYFVGGEHVSTKHRKEPGKTFWQSGGGKAFYNYDAIKLTDHPLVITEGELDCLVALQCGWPRAISVPDGAPNEKLEEDRGTKYDYVYDAEEDLADVKDIILAVDGDRQGGNLLHDLALRLGKARCRRVEYPEGCKDLNDVLLAHGAEEVDRVLAEARYCEIDGLYRMSELPPVPVREIYDVPGFEDIFRFRLGDFSVVTGIPGHGKSTVVNHLICSLVQQTGFPVCFASFEQNPQHDHRRNLRQWFTHKLVEHCTDDELLAADQWIEDKFRFIWPSYDDDPTLDWIIEKIEAAVLRTGVKVVVLDPWNEIDHRKADGDSLTVYVGNAIRLLKRVAAQFGVHVMVVAHPTKMRQQEDGTFDVPSLYSISDSANWANKADLGAVVYRLDENLTLFRTLKSRYHDQIGRPGQRKMSFSNHSGRFHVQHEANTFLD